MFEHRRQPLLSRRHFISRTLKYLFFLASTIGISLLFGMIGYHFLAHVSWTDAFYNASMILTGMGPALNFKEDPKILLSVEEIDHVKIFAGLYAMYSGVVFLAASGLLLSPLLHRFFHKLHCDIKG